MLLVKLEKKGIQSWTSMLDYRRNFVRGIQRAGLCVQMSQGFNPHELIFFSQPIPVGVESLCEYACIETEIKPVDFMEKYNEVCACGLNIISAVVVPKKLIFDNYFDYAEYEFEYSENVDLNIEAFLKQEQIIVERLNKRGEKQLMDIRQLIYSLDNKGNNKIRAVINFGNVVLKPTIMVDEINKFFAINNFPKITKKSVFTIKRNEFLQFDDIIMKNGDEK